MAQWYIESQDVQWQLVEPKSHLINTAEQSIQMFKNHLIVGLATVDKEVPIY